jgi:hypothetical protein
MDREKGRERDRDREAEGERERVVSNVTATSACVYMHVCMATQRRELTPGNC